MPVPKIIPESILKEIGSIYRVCPYCKRVGRKGVNCEGCGAADVVRPSDLKKPNYSVCYGS